MTKLKCINCENHALYDTKCNIGCENYNKNDKSIEKCYVESKLHQSLDKAIEELDNLIKNADC